MSFRDMQVNESSDNPCWKAIGYNVPELDEPREDGKGAAPSPPSTKRPLDDGVVETRALNNTTLMRSLVDKGLAVEPDAWDVQYHTVQCDAEDNCSAEDNATPTPTSSAPGAAAAWPP